VDIWALGCILYELIAGKSAFQSDIDVHDHYLSSITVEIGPTAALPMIDPSHLREMVHQLLDRDEQQRPPVTELLPIFDSYRTILQHLEYFSSSLDTFQTFPNYSQWKGLVQACQDEDGDIFSRWAGWYISIGNFRSAIVLLTCIIVDPKWYQAATVEQLDVVYTNLGNWHVALTHWKRLVDLRPKNSELRERLAKFGAKSRDPALAMKVWGNLVQEHPNDSFLTFGGELINHLENWQDQIGWLEYFLLQFPRGSIYQSEVERILRDKSDNLNQSSTASESQAYYSDAMWEEILALVEAYRVPLEHKLAVTTRLEGLQEARMYIPSSTR